MKSFSFFVWSLLPLLLSWVSGVNAQSDYCVTGYVMDSYCITLGTLLDNPTLRTLQYPDQHSVHCLIQVPSCVASGYNILTTPPTGQTDYVVAVQLDSAGNIKVQEMAALYGICSTCSGNGTIEIGFNATVVGILNNSTDPPTLKVTDFLPASVACNASDTSSQMPQTTPNAAPSVSPSSLAPVKPSATMKPTTSAATGVKSFAAAIVTAVAYIL